MRATIANRLGSAKALAGAQAGANLRSLDDERRDRAPMVDFHCGAASVEPLSSRRIDAARLYVENHRPATVSNVELMALHFGIFDEAPPAHLLRDDKMRADQGLARAAPRHRAGKAAVS